MVYLVTTPTRSLFIFLDFENNNSSGWYETVKESYSWFLDDAHGNTSSWRISPLSIDIPEQIVARGYIILASFPSNTYLPELLI